MNPPEFSFGARQRPGGGPGAGPLSRHRPRARPGRDQSGSRRLLPLSERPSGIGKGVEGLRHQVGQFRGSVSAFPEDELYGYRRRRYDDYEYGDSADGKGDRKYEIQELIDSEVTLTHWTGPNGRRLEETSLSVSDSDVCASTENGDLTPHSLEYEGYMGNWGNTLDRWYHRAAVVVWPRSQAFANRAETSPGWALDEITTMAAADLEWLAGCWNIPG